MTLLVFAVVLYLAVTVKAEDCDNDAKDGNCNFYIRCIEDRFLCGSNGYPLAYGNRYCHRLTNKQDCFTTLVSF